MLYCVHCRMTFHSIQFYNEIGKRCRIYTNAIFNSSHLN